MSQAEVPLEWIHVFYGKWVPSLCNPEILEVSYWVVPWDTTHAKAGTEAEPDDGR